MTNEERDIQRNLRALQHAERIGNARKACRYFGVGLHTVAGQVRDLLTKAVAAI